MERPATTSADDHRRRPQSPPPTTTLAAKPPVTTSTVKVKEDITFGEGEETWTRCVPFTVEFNGEINEANCNCRLFEFRGMVCRHQLMVFHERRVQRVPEKYVLRRWRKNLKRAHTKIRINYDNSSSTIEARRHDNMCNLFNEVADLAEDSQEKYDKVMGRLQELKRELIESLIVCKSNMVFDTRNDSFSLQDAVLPFKESQNILDPENADGNVFGTQESVANLNVPTNFLTTSKLHKATCQVHFIVKFGEDNRVLKFGEQDNQVFWGKVGEEDNQAITEVTDIVGKEDNV
ncbi:hypothetical protein RHMOL_Rhmol10G0199200 [Rhododendron molle]|uniref:Uncharacterized protein n=1 Tax=Rhododendron molle TaxID=49168 RepID=A0ACC0M471_RHOML|nr:hypothetical protein RHMOL_Rhmol10G0199200 [Rhododendron molle]